MPTLDLPRGWAHRHVTACTSTMQLLATPQPEEAAAPFFLLTTDYQTAGHGQLHTTWESAPAANLLFGFAFRPEGVQAATQFYLSMLLALSVAESLAATLSAAGSPHAAGVSIKWPNDIYIGTRKACGMLLTHTLSGARIARTVAGVGINVNQEAFCGDAPNPCSLRQLLGQPVSRTQLLTEVVQRFAHSYHALTRAPQGEELIAAQRTLEARYTALLFRRHGLHAYADRHGRFLAAIAGIRPDGTLLLRDSDNRLRAYHFKEVSYLLS